MTTVQELLARLWEACRHREDFGGDLWSRGLQVIQRNRDVVIYLSRFRPSDIEVAETSLAQVSITVMPYQR